MFKFTAFSALFSLRPQYHQSKIWNFSEERFRDWEMDQRQEIQSTFISGRQDK